ncbi:MAG TPA: hypothetical protein VGQ18_03515 [Gemmatimonadales bacterium]|nr:hypothetical protein [Gemmatimonadales bacterium]
MMDNEDSRFDQWLQEAAKKYNAPGPTPRDEMWARIQAERAERGHRVVALRPWLRWGLGAAAVLLVGIGIGRWTAHEQAKNGGTLADRPDTTGSAVVYQLAATQYLSRTETFLTGFRADLRAGRVDAFPSQARDLLATSRLLLDSPAADDPRMRALLEDLELVLVQISQLEAGRDRRNADLITQNMDQRNVLPKLRSAIPAGPVPVRTQGAT